VSALVRPLLGVVISAAAYYVSTGLGTFWPAAWIAPIPILLVAFKAPRRTAAALALAAYFLGSLNVFTYLTNVLPVAVVVIILLIPAAAFALAVLTARDAERALAPWAATFAFPAAWTAVEFVMSSVSPHGTAASLAYSQTDVLPLLQIASITGIWGITFIVTLVPSAVAVAWTRRSAAALAPAVVFALAIFGYGVWRLHQPLAPPTIRVGLAATDRGIGEAFATEDPTRAVAAASGYVDRVRRLAAAGAQVIVLPEKFVGVTPGDSADVLRVLSDGARAARATVVAGLNRVAVTPRRNVAVVLGPDGDVRAEYEKHHLLPGPETGYATGSTPALFAGPGAQWGVAICKDLDFPAWSRRYGQGGARFLAVPAWDFVRDGRLHSRMAVVRGVENGFTIIRAAQQGLLTVSDAHGRIVAEASSGSVPDALLVSDVGPGPGSTFYTRAGDWFAWVSIAALVGLLAASFRSRRGRA